jgi:hypothetical protein
VTNPQKRHLPNSQVQFYHLQFLPHFCVDFFETEFHYVAQAGLKLVMLLPLTPKC